MSVKPLPTIDGDQLNEVWFDTGLGHGSADCLAAPVDQDGLHSYRFHEDHVGQAAFDSLWIVQSAAAKFDDDISSTEVANPLHGLQQDISFADGFVHGRLFIVK